MEHQDANAEKYGALEAGPATYGVVKRLRDNDMDLHTDKQVSISVESIPITVCHNCCPISLCLFRFRIGQLLYLNINQTRIC